MRKTKIIATLGPASTPPQTLRALIRAGLDVARLNCSHSSHDDLRAMSFAVRRIAEEEGRHVALLLDLSGPKVRTGPLEGGSLELRAGQRLRVVPGGEAGSGDTISCNHEGLAADLQVDDRILLDDGLMELRVAALPGDGVVVTEVIEGGTLKPHKGMNLPDNTVSIPALTAKDRADLAVGVELNVDFVALSFVQRAADIEALQEALQGRRIPIIAKIEKPQAVDNLAAILDEADGIMVARGDLAVEVGAHRVPMLQKQLLKASGARGLVDIVATQMLESMTEHPRPTRAEASDVANAVLDGCDAVMLSGETAVGRYPVQTLAMMDRIAREAEPALGRAAVEPIDPELSPYPAITQAICGAAVRLARRPACAGIVVLTLSGRTALVLSGHAPTVPIFALTPHEASARRMALYRGVVPILMPFAEDSDATLLRGEERITAAGHLHSGDEAVVVAGFTELHGVANMVKIVKLP